MGGLWGKTRHTGDPPCTSVSEFFGGSLTPTCSCAVTLPAFWLEAPCSLLATVLSASDTAERMRLESILYPKQNDLLLFLASCFEFHGDWEQLKWGHRSARDPTLWFPLSPPHNPGTALELQAPCQNSPHCSPGICARQRGSGSPPQQPPILPCPSTPPWVFAWEGGCHLMCRLL